MKKKLSIAIIGCGRISNKHIEAINNNKFLELNAVCDIDKNKLNKIDNKISKYTNIDLMLLNQRFDLVSICTPSGVHPEHAIKCIKNKNNVLIEKPLGTNLKEVKKIFEINKKFNNQLFIVKQNRFNPTIQYLKKLISENLLGKIYFIEINVIWSRGKDYYTSAEWRGTKKLDGGTLLNQASHYVDLMFWLFGKPVLTQSLRTKLKADIETEDTFSANLLLENNIHCSFNATTTAYEKNIEGSILINCEKGSIKISGEALNKVNYINSKVKKILDLKKYEYQIDNVYGNGHVNVYKEIEKSLNGKTNQALMAKDGLNSLEWILEQYRKKIYVG